MSTGPHVRIVVDHEVVREVALHPPMTFGRSEDNDVVLDDQAVSGHHGRVERGPHGWIWVDCSRTDGTKVAGGPAVAPGQQMELLPHAQLMLGDTVLDFRLGEVEATERKPSAAPTVQQAAGQKPDAGPVDPSSLDPRLVVVADTGVTTHHLPMPRATLGRSIDCDVVLNHPSVSAQHAEINWTGHGWMVHDLDSTNGTRVGLIPVTEARPLVNAAHLIVGEVDLLFLHGGEEGAIAARDLIESLQRRGGLTRSDARRALDEHARTGRDVEEILMERQLLGPGSLYEMRHDALHGTMQEAATPREPGALTWILMAAAVAAIVWLLFG